MAKTNDVAKLAEQVAQLTALVMQMQGQKAEAAAPAKKAPAKKTDDVKLMFPKPTVSKVLFNLMANKDAYKGKKIEPALWSMAFRVFYVKNELSEKQVDFAYNLLNKEKYAFMVPLAQ